MRLSISNIAWEAQNDEYMYALMNKLGYLGLEIAPTRIFPNTPYDHIMQASDWVKKLGNSYALEISSMQSIWYGRQEKLFGSEEERSRLMAYTKSAIDFAHILGCNNLVFGAPRNRELLLGANPDVAMVFFKELGDYALEKNTVIALEANPTIYHTNYINSTMEAIQLIEAVGSDGFRLNLDVGTMIYNEEYIDILEAKVSLIQHVHISEPGLKSIEVRNLHRDLYHLLHKEKYQGYVSIETAKTDSLKDLEHVMLYVKEIFHGV